MYIYELFWFFTYVFKSPYFIGMYHACWHQLFSSINLGAIL